MTLFNRIDDHSTALSQTDLHGRPNGRMHRWLERLQRWQQLRHERQQLWTLNDATLKDIGLSRADVEREASRPFWDDQGWNR